MCHPYLASMGTGSRLINQSLTRACRFPYGIVVLRFASSSSPLLVECIPHFLNLSKHCPSQGSLVLTVYALGNHETHPLSGKGIICIWDMLSPNYPINILVADGDLTCACFAAEQLFFVAAGSREGNVFAWDLREARSARSLQVVTNAVICLSSPDLGTQY
jgi:hypothetical protein